MLLTGANTNAQNKRQTAKGTVCGNPNVRCRTNTDFEPWDLPFQVPPNGVIWETELFYAVILKSTQARTDCSGFISESDRQSAQAKFPNNKVFASRCAEPGNIYYSNTRADQNFMAVFAGRTAADAQRMLATVRAAGGYPGANIRRMRSGFNGT
jgi:hypothetical protein